MADACWDLLRQCGCTRETVKRVTLSRLEVGKSSLAGVRVINSGITIRCGERKTKDERCIGRDADPIILQPEASYLLASSSSLADFRPLHNTPSSMYFYFYCVYDFHIPCVSLTILSLIFGQTQTYKSMNQIRLQEPIFHSGNPGGTTEGSSALPPNTVGSRRWAALTSSSICAALFFSARPPFDAISCCECKSMT